VLQSAAVYCSVLHLRSHPYVFALCGSVLQCVAVRCSNVEHKSKERSGYVGSCVKRDSRVAVCCSVLQCVAVCCSVWQCAVVYNICQTTKVVTLIHVSNETHVLQCVAACCNVLQCAVVGNLYQERGICGGYD